MRQLTVFVLVLLLLPLVFFGCSRAHGKEVIAIEKTGTYHREGCPPVNMAKTKEMTVADAKAKHLKPCTVCKPDTL